MNLFTHLFRPYMVIRQLQRENTTLKEQNMELKDTNESLWDMLEETKGSESFGKTQVKSMMDELNDLLTDEMLKDFKPVGEA